jgi:hypothetical protein
MISKNPLGRGCDPGPAISIMAFLRQAPMKPGRLAQVALMGRVMAYNMHTIWQLFSWAGRNPCTLCSKPREQ